jgi:acylphosphatase/archaellum component FlaC
MRRRYVVIGNVQGVGYRAYVRNVARRFRIRGSVRNLADGSVEIHCEGPDDAMREFLRRIRIRPRDPFNPFAIDVEEIEEHEDVDETKLKWPFEVIYDGLTLMEREMLERSEAAIFVMTYMNDNLSSKMDTMLEKQDKMLEKQDHTLEKQDKMLEKQDKMLEKQDATLKAVERLDENMGQRFDWLADRYREFGEVLKSIERDLAELREMKNAIIRLVDHLTGKKKE